MSALINHALQMTFRDIAIAALAANGLDADTVLKEFVAGKRPAQVLTMDHEGTIFEFKKRGCSVNFELMARIKPEEQWLEIAFLSDH
jgi:hypothetical protein